MTAHAQATSERPASQRPEAFSKLEQALEHACTAGGWREYLQTQARFHRYSFRNLLLIFAQCPTASRVAGFHDWLKHSRCVRKGEKGIAILAPLKWSKTDKHTGETTSGIGGFRVVYVFDIAQTDGEPLPERPQITITDGLSDQASALTTKLMQSLKHDGIPVTFADLEPGHCGFYRRSDRSITLASVLGDVQRFSTLVHETAHAKLHTISCVPGTTGTTPQQITLEHVKQIQALQEFEAESVAFVVLEHFGVNVLECSAGYLASYGATPETLVKIGARVQTCAANIIEILEESRTEVQA
jgi:antirestriction protein ArdC